MGHSQSANVIVDVENGHDTGALLLQAASDVKQNHICSNAMQITGGGGGNGNSNNGGGGTGGGCQAKVPLGNDMYGTKNNRGCSNNGVQNQQDHHLVTTIPIKNQPQQQQQQQYGRNNSNQSYNAVGMMTLPKVGIGASIMQQQQHLGTMGYSNRNDCSTLPRNINSGNVGNHIGNCYFQRA